MRALAEAAGDLRTAIYVLGYGGLRYGELAALRVGDVDVTRRRVKVSRSVTAVAKLGMVATGAETHQARAVALSEFVMDLLAEHIKGRWPGGTGLPRTTTAPGPHATGSHCGWRRRHPWPSFGGVAPGTRCWAHRGSLAPSGGLGGHVAIYRPFPMNVYARQLPDDFDNLAAEVDAAARTAATAD